MRLLPASIPAGSLPLRHLRGRMVCRRSQAPDGSLPGVIDREAWSSLLPS